MIGKKLYFLIEYGNLPFSRFMQYLNTKIKPIYPLSHKMVFLQRSHSDLKIADHRGDYCQNVHVPVTKTYPYGKVRAVQSPATLCACCDIVWKAMGGDYYNNAAAWRCQSALQGRRVVF